MKDRKEIVKDYDSKCETFAIKYTLSDIEDGKRLRIFLKNNGISANSYIKSLIKADLNAKGIPYPENDSTELGL